MQVPQGFPAFCLALSRIPPRHSQTTRATNCANPGFLVIEFCARCGQTCGHGDFLTTSTCGEIACISGVSRDCGHGIFRLEGGATRSQTRRDTNFAIPGYSLSAIAPRRRAGSGIFPPAAKTASYPTMPRGKKQQETGKFSARLLHFHTPSPGRAGCTSGSVTSARNRSASMDSRNVPPISCTRLCAMDSPSPLPSVCREASPRTKRSISSSGEMFSSARDTFLKLSVICPSATVPDT